MEAKKNPKLNLEGKRGIYFQIGLIVSLSSSFLAFEWTSLKVNKKEKSSDQGGEVVWVLPDIPLVIKKLPELPKVKLINALLPPKIVENNILEPKTIEANKSEETFIPSLFSKVGFEEETLVELLPYVRQAEVMPLFKGGEKALFKFIKQKMRYPEICLKEKIGGAVYVEFIIEKDGSVSEVTLVRGANPYLDKEAERIVRLLPNWIPGRQSNEPVRVKMVLPLIFTAN